MIVIMLRALLTMVRSIRVCLLDMILSIRVVTNMTIGLIVINMMIMRIILTMSYPVIIRGKYSHSHSYQHSP